MLLDYIVTFGNWSWLIAAAIFFVLELVAPGAFMLWLGISAMLVGIIGFMVAWAWQYQLVAFAVFAIISIPLWRHFTRSTDETKDQPFLNRRADGFVGREFTLDKPIVGGNGTVRIDDTIWRLSGPDLAGGSRVKVVRADAALLVVEPI
jgi:membrane protein implicated in regulation of membrane protease activity